MWEITEEIIKTVSEQRIECLKIEEDEMIGILFDINKKYVKENVEYEYLWEVLCDKSSIDDQDGWRKIQDFVQNDSAILFYFENGAVKGFVFKDGYDLVKTIGETYGFEFYVTNIQTTYLICFNHHNYLIGAGSAKEWVEQLLYKLNKD